MFSFRKTLIVLFVGFLTIFLQGAFLKSIFPNHLVPNLLLDLVVFLGFYEANSFGAVLTFLLGIEFDICSGTLLGPWAASFLVVYAVLSSVAQRVFVESSLAIFVAVFISSLASNVTYLVLLYEFKPVETNIISVSLIEALFTALMALPFFRLLRPLLVRRGHGTSGRRMSVQVS